ncbi:MAG: hypothetical protein C5B47_05020 [Verrucomicrobia bacterium]|nr:MAG: hypothetical protein C5B47_05020 [Verrucomicrobiota bacterium]
MSEPNLLTDKANVWEMDLFWEKHKRRVLIGAMILGVLAIGAAVSLIWDYHVRSASTTLFARASTSEQLKTIISKYPSSNAAANALLLLAADQRSLGNLAESNATYQKFLKQFPKHSLIGGAAVGLAENALIGGRVEEGISQLQTVAVKYPTSYAASYALYTEANLLVFQPGQVAEAQKQLRNLKQQFPDSVSAQQATNLLALLGSRPTLDEGKFRPPVTK